MARLIEFSLRHPLLVGATLLALVAAVVYEIWQRGQANVAISAQEAVRLINQGATVVDLRDAGKFSGGHIVDSVNLSPAEVTGDPEARLKKKRPVLLVCDNGSHSARLVDSLRKAGFENAWSLEGGLASWQRENLPVVPNRAKA